MPGTSSPTPARPTARSSWPTRTWPSASADPELGRLTPSLLQKDSTSPWGLWLHTLLFHAAFGNFCLHQATSHWHHWKPPPPRPPPCWLWPKSAPAPSGQTGILQAEMRETVKLSAFRTWTGFRVFGVGAWGSPVCGVVTGPFCQYWNISSDALETCNTLSSSTLLFVSNSKAKHRLSSY